MPGQPKCPIRWALNISFEEKAAGLPLGRLWSDMSTKSRLHIVDQIVDMERRLSFVGFSKHGCIYYRVDLERKAQSYAPLEETIINADSTLRSAHDNRLDRFALGPLNDSKFWHGKRSTMNLDRGPCMIMMKRTNTHKPKKSSWIIIKTRSRPQILCGRRSSKTPIFVSEPIPFVWYPAAGTMRVSFPFAMLKLPSLHDRTISDMARVHVPLILHRRS